jgi:hypothetical protein
MKKLILCWALLFICGMAGEAGAALYSETFLDDTDNSQYIDLGRNDNTSFNFDLRKFGFDSSSIIDAATLHITFSDADDKNDIVGITSGTSDGNSSIFTSANLGIPYTNGVRVYQTFDYDLSSLLTYLSDGQFSVNIATNNAKNNSIRIDKVSLDVNTVPIPSAAWLFGAGIIGLVAVKRKKSCC